MHDGRRVKHGLAKELKDQKHNERICFRGLKMHFMANAKLKP